MRHTVRKSRYRSRAAAARTAGGGGGSSFMMSSATGMLERRSSPPRTSSPPAGARHAEHIGVQPDHPAPALDLALHGPPHHSRPEPRIVELLDERADRLAGLPVHLQEQRAQREILDPLRRPVGLQLGAREAPHLLRIGLEEREEQTSPEPIRDPVLERVLVPVREEPPLDVAQDDAEALPGPQAAQGVHGPEGIVEEPPLVIDAGQPRAADEIVAEDL